MNWLIENTTKKQSWLILIVGLIGWGWVGRALCEPNAQGVRPISDWMTMGAYFAGLLTLVAATIPQAVRQHKADKLAKNDTGQ